MTTAQVGDRDQDLLQQGIDQEVDLQNQMMFLFQEELQAKFQKFKFWSVMSWTGMFLKVSRFYWKY
jgi:hypothetical protein